MFGKDLRRELDLERSRRQGFEDALTGAILPEGGAAGATAEEREEYRHAYQRGEQAARRLLGRKRKG